MDLDTPQQGASVTLQAPQATGRQIVKFRAGSSSAEIGRLFGSDPRNRFMSTATVSTGLASAVRAVSAARGNLLLDRLGVAVLDGPGATSLGENLRAVDIVEDVRPEFWMFAIEGPPWGDSAASTWGLEGIGALSGSTSGAGVRVAVLDTGLDFGHADFMLRRIVSESFVPAETADDVAGHGTHCAGTACGSQPSSGNLPRYGVAPAAELYVAKVLNNKGAGREGDILAGMEWAMANSCAVISMSLGRRVAPDEPHDPLYEEAGRRALDAGCLIIAAAGNDSDRRYRYIAPVGAPANSPSIMAVAAIGADEGIATFSSGGVGLGKIDIAAPGVGIFSSVPRPELYKKLSGTSMACPHVAGAAARWAETDPNLRGQALWDKLVATATDIGLGPVDVGAGLVRCPP